jgi:hypothetical protein
LSMHCNHTCLHMSVQAKGCYMIGLRIHTHVNAYVRAYAC